jgi:tripartite-type tricarboxylate transporter receptor subunit TctC
MSADGLHQWCRSWQTAPSPAPARGKPINLDEWAIIGGYMPQERVVFAAKNAPFNTFQEMVEYAKKSPVAFADGTSFWSARVMEAYAKKHHLQIAV